MSLTLFRRTVFLILAAAGLAFIMTTVPSHAYINRGTVQINGPGTSVLQVGETTSMSITPYEEDHYPGCQMAECPRICGEKDCITIVNGQMECTCEGTVMQTYYAIVEASSSDPSVATAEYDDSGSVVITAVSPGSAQISVDALFREYNSASRTLTVTVEDPSASGEENSGPVEDNDHHQGPDGNEGEGAGTPQEGTPGNGPEGQGSPAANNPAVRSYKISLASAEECHAVLHCDLTEAAEGDAVMVRASAMEGYLLNGILVTDVKGNKMTTKGVGGIYEFTMPASDVSVSAEVSEVKPVIEKPFPFMDVDRNRWSRASVEFVFNRELFNGTEETLFSPEMSMTRGMLVTVLYRLDGIPEITGDSAFTDVKRDAYYAKAVKWASDHGIVLGIEEGIFAPENIITREQLVTIMYRYAKYKGYSTNFTGILQDFSDDNRQISSYAETPFKWAVSRGIVTGVTSTSLAPQGSATREQVAAIVMRFVQKFVG